ncbi:AraC family transcriptional regulator [Knoellia sp. S7-12]|uniref:AraC family transcriptional regulator n=1 Tax=Knoellia sp. S7-12 TaxID=3126698 RepID=UPI003367BD27
MEYEEWPAPPGLERLVSRMWFLEVPRVRRFEKILPLPFVHLIINLSDPYAVVDRSGTATQVGGAFISGIQTEYLVIEQPPLIRHLGVELLPAGLGAVTDVGGPQIAGRVQDARLLVPGLSELIDDLVVGFSELDKCRTSDLALDRMTTLLLSRHAARSSGSPLPDPLVASALASLEENPSRPINALAVGVSQRTLLARFRAATGMSPKTYAQVLRFHRLVTALATSSSVGGRMGHAASVPGTGMEFGWADVATGSGYYDQPHVIRAFRRFCGWTPTEYIRRVDEFGPDAALFVPLDEVPRDSDATTKATTRGVP